MYYKLTATNVIQYYFALDPRYINCPVGASCASMDNTVALHVIGGDSYASGATAAGQDASFDINDYFKATAIHLADQVRWRCPSNHRGRHHGRMLIAYPSLSRY